MIEISNCVGPSNEQMFSIIMGMRNPMNSWSESDSVAKLCGSCNNTVIKEFAIGPKDKTLMMRLRMLGPDHRKFMRMMPVHMDILAPLYWWKEFDTYKIGTATNSCSTMHKLTERDLTIDDFSVDMMVDDLSTKSIADTVDVLNCLRRRYLAEADEGMKKQLWYTMIQLLPSSYNQLRTVSMNYEVLANIYSQRKAHKLDEWKNFCEWLESFPYGWLITGKEDGPKTTAAV